MQGISLSELTSMSPQEQKQLLGERLFMRVLDIDPLFHDRDLAGKITGMLLEMDNAGIINLLESQNALRGMVEEAIAVLEAHELHKSAMIMPTRTAVFTSVVTNHPALQVCKLTCTSHTLICFGHVFQLASACALSIVHQSV